MKKILLVSASLLLMFNPLISTATNHQLADEEISIVSENPAINQTEVSEEVNEQTEEVSNEVEIASSESEKLKQVESSLEEASQTRISDVFNNNNSSEVLPYLSDSEKYQELLAEIIKNTDYASENNQVNDNVRAGKKRGVAEFLGISPEKLLQQLKKHQSDRYYLGTPFKGLWEPVAQNMSPLGNPNKYGPGFNCTGFVATVFKEAGARNSEITKRANAWGGIGNAYNWRNALLPNVEYYSYNSVDALLKSGKASKGDILYFEPNYSIPGYDPHIGFFWGNTPSHNRMWHSYDSNIMSNIKAGRPWTKIYLFKLQSKPPVNQQGKYIKFNKYVQVKSDKFDIYKDFKWTVKNKSSKVLNKTYFAQGKYKYKGGDIYYSIFDNKGKWQGYINAKAVNVTTKYGKAFPMNDYVELHKKNYSVWSNFDWLKKYNSKEKLNQKFLVKAKYNHYNGSTYYSLTDTKGKWQGYVNKNATKISAAKGPYIKFNKYVQVKSQKYNIYKDFKWTVMRKSSKVLNKTYLAQGKYQHKNGETYYTIYDHKNNWQGYINAKAVNVTEAFGKAIKVNDYVQLTEKNYRVWKNFDWQKAYNSKEKLNQKFLVKNKYNHFNGKTYYSLKDTEGIWQGYVNKNATEISTAKGPYIKFNKYVQVKSGKFDIYKDFKWTVMRKSSKVLNKTYLAQGKYQHKNGETYYTIYDHKNKWQGYINAKAVNVTEAFGKAI